MGASPRPLPGPAAWACTHLQSVLGGSGCGGQNPGSWESLSSKSAWLFSLHCSSRGAACAHQHTPSARSCCCPQCLLPSRILPLCGLSVLGQFDTGRADLSAILGDACADPKISSPYGKNPRVNRKGEQMGLPGCFRDLNDAHKTFLQTETILLAHKTFIWRMSESAGWRQSGLDQSLWIGMHPCQSCCRQCYPGSQENHAQS